MAGDITDIDVFESTMSNYFGVSSTDITYPKIVYADDYEIVIGYDADHFIVGYGQSSQFAFQKIETYFNNPAPIIENKMLQQYLNRQDDVSYYLAVGKLIEFIDKINDPLARLFLSNIKNLDEYSSNLYAALNFNNGDVILSGNSDFKNQTGKSVYASGGVDDNFKNYLTDNNKLILFGFLNINPENFVVQANQLSNIGKFRDLNSFLKIMANDELIETMDGQISFSIINLPEKVAKSSSENAYSEEDYWSEKGFDVEDELPIDDYDLNGEIPKMIISMGVNDVDKLKSFSEDNDISIVEDQIISIDPDRFLLLKNNILHIATANTLLEIINIEGKLKTYTAIEEDNFNKPIYGAMNFDLSNWPANLVDEINHESALNSALQEMKNFTISASHNELQLKLEFNDTKENTLKRILEFVMENQIIEEFI